MLFCCGNLVSVLHLWKNIAVWEQLNNTHVNKNEETDWWWSKYIEIKCSFRFICIIVLPSVSRKIIKNLSWLANYYWTNQRKHSPIYLKCDTMLSQLHLYSYIYCCTISDTFYGQFAVYFVNFEEHEGARSHLHSSKMRPWRHKESCTYSVHVWSKLIEANKSLFILRSLRKEGLRQDELDIHLFTSIVLPNYYIYSLSIYGVTDSDLTTILHFLDTI